MNHKEIEKRCDENINRMISESAGTKDFSVTYTVWNPIVDFVVNRSECGRRSASVDVEIGTAVYELYTSYRRLAIAVYEKLKNVFAPLLDGEIGAEIYCEKRSNGITVRLRVD